MSRETEEELAARIQRLESILQESQSKKGIISSFFESATSLFNRLFCRQNLELVLSLISLAVSLSIAFYLFGR